MASSSSSLISATLTESKLKLSAYVLILKDDAGQIEIPNKGVIFSWNATFCGIKLECWKKTDASNKVSYELYDRFSKIIFYPNGEILITASPFMGFVLHKVDINVTAESLTIAVNPLVKSDRESFQVSPLNAHEYIVLFKNTPGIAFPLPTAQSKEKKSDDLPASSHSLKTKELIDEGFVVMSSQHETKDQVSHATKVEDLVDTGFVVVPNQINAEVQVSTLTTQAEDSADDEFVVVPSLNKTQDSISSHGPQEEQYDLKIFSISDHQTKFTIASTPEFQALFRFNDSSLIISHEIQPNILALVFDNRIVLLAKENKLLKLLNVYNFPFGIKAIDANVKDGIIHIGFHPYSVRFAHEVREFLYSVSATPDGQILLGSKDFSKRLLTDEISKVLSSTLAEKTTLAAALPKSKKAESFSRVQPKQEPYELVLEYLHHGTPSWSYSIKKEFQAEVITTGHMQKKVISLEPPQSTFYDVGQFTLWKDPVKREVAEDVSLSVTTGPSRRT